MKRLARISTTGAVVCSILLLGACRRSPTGPSGNGLPPILQDYRKLVLTLTDFSVVRITHQEGLELRSPNIVRIGIGTKDSSGYRESIAAATAFDSTYGMYLIRFDYSVRTDSTQAIYPLTVRYYLVDSTAMDADTTVLSYKYPYASAELVVPFSVLQSLGARHFQDVDRIGRHVFFHPMGGFGLYMYDLDTRDVTELLQHIASDHIAAESVFVFFDYDLDRVYRFNLTTNTIDQMFTAFAGDVIRGLEVYERSLYVRKGFSQLRKYTLDGILLDSVDFCANMYLTIDSGIVYSVDVAGYPNRILRYDMQTGMPLPPILSPARATDGIKISGGKLYYCDYDKRVVNALRGGGVKGYSLNWCAEIAGVKK